MAKSVKKQNEPKPVKKTHTKEKENPKPHKKNKLGDSKHKKLGDPWGF